MCANIYDLKSLQRSFITCSRKVNPTKPIRFSKTILSFYKITRMKKSYMMKKVLHTFLGYFFYGSTFFILKVNVGKFIFKNRAYDH